MARPLILASQSPRRKSLLEQAGLSFDIRPAEIDETPRSGEGASPYVLRMAKEKAEAIPRDGAVVLAADPREGSVVLAADTIVVLDGTILGKPADRADAHAMISRLAGRTHSVMTAFAVVGEAVHAEIVTTEVGFRPLRPSEIDRFLDQNEHLDKAGAYGIQSSGGGLTSEIRGSYTNVVGLPVAEVLTALLRAGVALE